MSNRKIILVMYYTRGVFPLRNTIETHLYCWKNYSKHRVIYINVALGYPSEYLKSIPIDVVVFHTSFCGMRWNSRVFYNFTTLVEDLAESKALKIAMPQDEFIHTDYLCEFLNDIKIDYVFTCAYENEWDNIYGGLTVDNVKFRTVLTGYLDDKTVDRIKRYQKPLNERSIWISYRAWRAAYWLGYHATHKVKVGEVFDKALQSSDRNVDISLNDEDTLAGDDWFKFLCDSRATIGVEGGASILDRDGKLKEKVDAYVAENPDASFEETRDACFPADKQDFTLACLSPRHLEAVATKTCQILLEGEFNGILKAKEHYIPVKPDYSNIQEALEQLEDDELVSQMIERAYVDIVEPGTHTYRGFVKTIEEDIIDALPSKGKLSLGNRWKIWVLRLRDKMNWRIIQAEVTYNKNPEKYRPFVKFAKPIYKALVDLPKF